MNRVDHLLAVFGLERRTSSYDALAPGNWGKALPVRGYVSAANVLSNLAVAARCVSLRSELLASVPLKLYRRLPNGDRERVTDTPLADVLGDLANPLMTAFEARELFTRSLDTAGNAYARVERDGAGQVVALWPLEPARVTVERLESGRLRYRYSGDRPVTLLMEETLHIRASSEDGLIGRSPIAIARDALGLSLELNTAAKESASKNIGGYIIQSVDTNARQKRAFRDNLTTGENNGQGGGGAADREKPTILDPGVKFIPRQFSSADAELLESRKLSNEDTCRIFNCPPGAIGIANSVSYGSAFADAASLVQNCLAPLAQRTEQALMRCLLTPAARRLYIIEHDLGGLLRGDAQTQWGTTYRVGRETGILSVNECRRFQNLPPVEGGDDHTPMSLQERGEPPEASAGP